MVDTVTCGNCKYWKPITDYKVGKMLIEYKLCTKHSQERDFDASNVNATAVCLSEGIEGELLTKENFGCIEGELNERK